MSSATIKANKATIDKMKAYYSDNLKKKAPQYSTFSAKVGSVTITAYTSGKVLFQGNGADEEASKWGSVAPSKTKVKPVNNLLDNFSSLSVIGSDETGTGSYLGPLTVAAAYVSKENIPLLKELGVRDSKNLTDFKIKELTKQLVTIIPYTLLTVWPDEYNDVQPTMSQGEMKAKLHNKALYDTIQKVGDSYDAILIDQFELPQTYFKHIKDSKVMVIDKVYFATKGESHHLSVAAASIIARHAFIEGLVQLSRKYKVTLPSGASKQSDIAATEILEKYGEDGLRQVAKLHFANTNKARKLFQKRQK